MFAVGMAMPGSHGFGLAEAARTLSRSADAGGPSI